MCRENKECLVILFVALLLVAAWGALQAEEQWFLISESEVRGIEKYKETSEQEKRDWLLQASELRVKAEKSEARSARLETESASFNSQLAQAREQNRKLEQFFSEFVDGQLALISSKNGEIAGLKLEKAELKAESKKRLIIIIALAGAIAMVLGKQAFQFLRKKLFRK